MMTVARQNPGRIIAVAMSGGVDSSVAAALLLDAGFRVFGITMETGGPPEAPDPIDGGPARDAKAVCEHLGIEHHVIDLRELFSERVLRRCWEDYSSGRTPNPCVVCNRHVKFGRLLEEARRLGADFIATGHHVQVERRDGGFVVRRGQDPQKDQSYFLSRLTQHQLSRVLFPIGDMTKREVREAARQRSLPSADSRESQDTCLDVLAGVGREGAFAETLRKRFGEESTSGELVVLEDGRVVGRHRGLHLYTVGQRRGLGVSLGAKAYVESIDATSRRVVLTTNRDALLSKELWAFQFRWQHPSPPPDRSDPFPCDVQIRYRHRAVPAMAQRLDETTVFVEFQEPIAAVTPGQAAVLYDGDEVIGCGWINVRKSS